MSADTPLPQFLRGRWSLLPVAFLLVVLGGCASLSGPPPANDHAAVAESIRAHYEQALLELSPDKQRHYAQRLYRITGDARYLPLNQAQGWRLIRQIQGEIDGLESPDHVARRARELLEEYPERTEKRKKRKVMFTQWHPMIYAAELPFSLVQAKSYGLLNERDLPGFERILDYLSGVDFRAFLLDEEVISIYAAQMANLVFFLHDLEVVDLREEAITTFRRQYPPERDRLLSDEEYRNKVYGMTHFVIAASNYYQRPVTAREFAWVLDEFAANLDQILERTKEDIFIEVGICFLLAGQNDHPAVQRLRDAVVAAYDPDTRMIPSEGGLAELEGGEHRNVLAIMLLTWPEKLFAGPEL